jgi:DnaJ-class molecular chaperone
MSLYERLGLQKNADAQEIRKAYLKLSKTTHPDKGGDAETFKKLQQAYEILSDDGKRGFYDQTGQIPGEEVDHPQSGGIPFPFDLGGIFGNMFGGGPGGPGGPFRQQNMKQQKAPPKIHEIGLSLRDFYYGKTIQVKFERQKFCTTCRGEGAEMFEICKGCGGSGFRESRIMMGPGMQAITRGPCGQCGTAGKQPVSNCSKCNGVKFTTHEKTLHVKIEPGMRPGEVLIFPNECSDHHDFHEPGDVRIIMRDTEENSQFTRTGDDLSCGLNIRFAEGILGTERVIQGHPAHPDGLLVKIPIGTMHGDDVVVEGEGMPKKGSTHKGNLHLKITLYMVQEDKAILTKNRELLKGLFP